MPNQKESKPIAVGLTVLSALGRLVPHAPNVTPLGGSCLFAGSKLSGLLAYLLPLVVMLVTDPFVGGYTWLSPLVYACFLINVFIGRTLLRNATAVRVGAAAFLCSLQFFVFTVGGGWVIAGLRHSAFYTPGFAGLMKSYALALPFWGRTLAGDLLFSAAIFGMYALLSSRQSRELTGERDLQSFAGR